ncbi:MAG: YfhO family protein, partial [Chloroflexota bacterium]
VQLLPTLELAQLSGRGGGLPVNEVVSFSLHPLLLPQALLPRFGQVMFTEYVAWTPLALLLLGTVGAWQWRRTTTARGPLALVAGGLFLALGRFNLVYLLLAQLPGFSYFRAPTRWLALYALGVALLAGLGLDVLRGAHGPMVGLRSRRALLWGAALAVGLVVLAFVVVPLAVLVPVGQESPVVAPTWLQVGAWIIELGLALLLLWQLPRAWESLRQRLVLLVGVALVIVLFLGSRTLPYNRLTSSAAFLDLRPPITRLQALQRCDLLPEQCASPPGRLLSLSDIFFDPGDQVELETVYGDRLSEEGFYDLIIAIKQKEIVAPNLPLAYGLASVDGFDGGILPLRDYVSVTGLVLPEEVAASDGRLREYLEAVPEARWLDLFGARYVITDKVGDEWRGDVFFDTQHAQVIEPGEQVAAAHVPAFEATALWILADEEPERVMVTMAAGDTLEIEPEGVEEGLWRVGFAAPLAPQGVAVMAGGEPVFLRGLALVDERDMTFRTIVPGNYRLIYSGDVKIYENLDVMPRAFLVHEWQWASDVADSVEVMEQEGFDSRTQAVLVGEGVAQEGSGDRGEAQIVRYRAEEVVVETSSEGPSVLVLTDADYPGWQAAVDGEPVEVYTVDGMFRGVILPEGEHTVQFEFRPSSFGIGRWVTLGALLVWLGVLGLTAFRKRT